MPPLRPKWIGHPNLRLRPHAPNLGRGRLQTQIRRAFTIAPVLSSSELYDWCYPRKPVPLSTRHRYSVWRILRRICECVGRAETIGRPWLWRLRNSSDEGNTRTR